MKGTFICYDGLNGLMRYLTIKKVITLTRTENTVSLDIVQKQWKYEPFFFTETQTNNVICKSKSEEEAFTCLYAFISTKYYKQIISGISKESVTTVVDGDGNEYNVFTSGKVTTIKGEYVCEGGVQGLIAYLTKQMQSKNIQTTTTTTTTYYTYSVESQRVVTSIVTDTINLYVDNFKNEYLLYNNGSLYDKSSLKWITDYRKVITTLTWVNTIKVPASRTYTIVRVSGGDEHHIYDDGSVYYLGSIYISNGGLDALLKYLSGKTIIRTTYSDSYVYIDQLGLKFKYLSKPDRFIDESGYEVARSDSYKGAFSILISYVSSKYWLRLVGEPVAKFTELSDSHG